MTEQCGASIYDPNIQVIQALDNLNATAQDMVEQLKEINRNLSSTIAFLRQHSSATRGLYHAPLIEKTEEEKLREKRTIRG